MTARTVGRLLTYRITNVNKLDYKRNRRKDMRKLLMVTAVSALMLGTATSPAVAQDLTLVSESPALQARAVQLRVRSERMDRDYLIEVTAPGRPPVLPGQKAAVIYALDGGWGVAGPSGWLLGGGGAMLPAYIVTIGYPTGSPNSREADLLFGPGTRPDGTVARGGKAEDFTAFLLEELRPFIEARYPVDPRRSVLIGHSLSGIYTANLLANGPDAFAGFLIASPSVWADPGVVERLTALRPANSHPRVYVAYGEREDDYMVTGGQSVAAALSADPSRFDLKVQPFAGESHITYYPALMSAALPFLLPRQVPLEFPTAVSLTDDQLARYEGRYDIIGGPPITVTRKGKGLEGQVADFPAVPLSPQGNDRFFVQGLDVRVDFFGAAPGPATSLDLYANGDKVQATRSR